VTFFENQALARRHTALMVALFVLAVVGVVLAVNAIVPLAFYLTSRGMVPLPPGTWVWLTLGTLAVIGGRTLVGVVQLRGGGEAVAQLAGGVPVVRGTRDPDERRLLNVVDEMAIASGVSVPRVYLLPGERGINAFAAGYSPNEAVLAVTEGAARTLTRDELQGVMAHEFSHILNGDMRLNIRMIGVLAGILFIGEIGNFLLRLRSEGDSRKGGGLLFVGAALLIIGYGGLFFGRLIKAAVSRQREFLADASSVQFTRNPEGIAGALATIGSEPGGSLVRARRAETLSHMFFANGVSMWFESVFATHPPLLERIARVDARFNPLEYLRRRRPRSAEPAEAVALVAPPARRPAGAPAPVAPLAPPPARAPVPPGAPAEAARAGRVAGVLGSVGALTPSHVAYASAVLEGLPAAVHEAVADPEGTGALLLALALSDDEPARAQQLALLEAAGAAALARRADALATETRALPIQTRLPIVALAGPSLRRMEPPAREALARQLQTLVEADHRITLEESVLLTLARRHLAPTPGRAPVRFRSIREVRDDARLVLSLLAHAGGGDTAVAFARGTAALELADAPLLPREAMEFARVGEALGRLAALAPFVKGRLLEACVETVIADETVSVVEAEVLRAVAAALDCPVPPILAQ
jgi:Zn-dependent protease with chaperone function